MSEKPEFDPNKPFQVADKPEFDPDQPFHEMPAPSKVPMAASASAGAISSIPFAKQIGAAGKTATDVLSGVTPIGDSLDEYRRERDALTQDLGDKAAANPKSAMLGGLAGMAALPVSATAEGMAAFGGANALSESKADLTKGEIGPALDDTLKGTAMGGVLGGATQTAAPYVQKGFEKLNAPVADYLRKLAEKKAVQSTGATAVQTLNKFPENAGRELLDRGIVGFGDTQKSIAGKASEALDQSGREIGSSLSALDEQGGKVTQDKIIDGLRQRAKDLSKDPASLDIADGLRKMADRLEERSQSMGAEADQSLSSAENSKRIFAKKAENLYGSPLENSVNKEAASVFRGAVEDQATQMNPEIAKQFQTSKQDYSILRPIEKATERRAAVNSQRQGVNFHGVGKGALGAALGGEEGYRHGGVAGGIAGAAAGAFVAPRIAASSAAGADFLSNIVKSSPQSLGKWAPVLGAAATRGGNALPASDYILQQTDPEYREHMRNLKKSGESILSESE